MPPEKHAFLSASSASRWLNCPPSARLCENYEDKGSTFAAEGTDAHALCEYRLKQALTMECENPIENLSYYNKEMEDCATGYASFVLEITEEAKKTCKDPIVLIEQRVDYSRYVKEGFGTADCIVIADGTLHIIDYKHGRGVKVSAEENPQMKCYSLGALELFDGIYDIERVEMTIYQPRLSNISRFEVTKKDLYKWANEKLKPAADLAFEGAGDFACGEWCQFCKAKYDCRKRAEHNLSLAKYDFVKPPLLKDSEVEEILGKIEPFISWANDIKDYALKSALGGKRWKGWKLVEGRSLRKFTDETLVAETAIKAGYEPYDKKLLGITEMQKQMGKDKFNELLGELVIKPQGKLALVPETDKRPEITPATTDFNN